MQQLPRRIKKVRSVFAVVPVMFRHIVTMLSSINRNYTPFLLVFEQKYYKVFIKIVTFSHFFLVVLLFISDIPYIPPYAAVYWRFPRAL